MWRASWLIYEPCGAKICLVLLQSVAVAVQQTEVQRMVRVSDFVLVAV
jgi:hypothetical protein